MGSLTITAELVPHGPAAAFVLSDEQVATIGEGAQRFRVTATINGTPLQLAVARMKGEFLLGLSRANREAAGVQAGDTVTFEVALDTGERAVEVPEALAAALAQDDNADARARFDALAYTHRKEFARWVAEAKRDETRDRRVTKTLEMLRAGETRS